MPKEVSVSVQAVLKAQEGLKAKPEFKEIFEAFAARDRARKVMRLKGAAFNLYRQGCKGWDDQGLQEFFEFLQSTGVGAIEIDETEGPVFVFWAECVKFSRLVLGKDKKELDKLLASNGALAEPPKDRSKYSPIAHAAAPPPPATKAAAPTSPKPTDDFVRLVREFLSEIQPTSLTPRALIKFTEVLLHLNKTS